MDDTDRKLLILVHAEPRIHYQELASRLGISRQAVHHRMQMLKESGVIQGTTAGISISYLDAIPIAIFGTSKTSSIEGTLDRLGQNELTRRVVVAGGNYLYVVGLLRKMSDLDRYAEFVKRVAEMPDPVVGIYSMDASLMPEFTVDGVGKRKQSARKLGPLDLKIIASLKDDARKSVAEIAEIVDASAKTVRRHLEEMITEGLLEMHMWSDTPSAGDMLFLVHLRLRAGADRNEVCRRILSDHPFEEAYIRAFSNLPGFLVWVFWTDKLPAMRRVVRELGENRDIISIMPNFAYLEKIYSTWRDNLPEVTTRPR
ncbi:MAG: winged helix-turn-helix transcriptional regulator [Candidatus Thermoplasmatota archaeon]|nr:winged helix-turn-helix transcriptional regulator [Candidatus Thermoplasmatota archaeon]